VTYLLPRESDNGRWVPLGKSMQPLVVELIKRKERRKKGPESPKTQIKTNMNPSITSYFNILLRNGFPTPYTP